MDARTWYVNRLFRGVKRLFRGGVGRGRFTFRYSITNIGYLSPSLRISPYLSFFLYRHMAGKGRRFLASSRSKIGGEGPSR